MRRLPALTLVLFIAGAAALSAAARLAADATFRDASFIGADGSVVPTDMIRSDGRGTFQDGIFCVNSSVDRNQFFLRTVKSGCATQNARALTLDFRQPVSPPDSCSATDAYVGGTLNLCGSNLVADVRVIASSAFSRNAPAGGTPLRLIFSLSPNYSGPGSFDLVFEQNVAVSEGSSSNIRQITASATAIAELYQNVPTNKNASVKVSLGRYYMPTSMAVRTLQ